MLSFNFELLCVVCACLLCCTQELEKELEKSKYRLQEAEATKKKASTGLWSYMAGTT